MKKLLGVVSIIAMLGASTAFATAIDSTCRAADSTNLEASVGVSSSSPWTTVQPRQLYSLTGYWPIPKATAIVNNVSVRVASDTPATVKAQFIIYTENGIFFTPFVAHADNEFCLELSDYVTTTVRTMPRYIGVRFLGGRGGIGINGLFYTGVSRALASYTIIDATDSSPDYPKILNFDTQTDYRAFMLKSISSIMTPSIMGMTLICDDSSYHNLTAEHLERTAAGLKLHIEGICAVNARLEITSSMMPPVLGYQLLGK